MQRQAQAGANKQLSNVLMQLRKISNHPLLVRHSYTDDKLRLMARQIMREPEYCEANQDYIFEDMTYMSDFELHTLCKKFKSIHKFQLEESQWMDAGKVQKLEEVLPGMRDRGDRVLIFSQFVIMLDVLEEVMDSLGMKFLRLDGQTSVGDRQGLIDLYNTDESYTVFLISTKAGGVGINLTSANVVILYDMVSLSFFYFA
jgi:SWI/SNF-related matrix-associated actin-dependent regulator 1 of chromatin subfamily A